MLLEISLALILGLMAGTLTGLFPGLHINLISTILTSSLAITQAIPIIALVVFIVAMSITHTFLDFIPSILLGAPEEDSFLSILPGHQLLQEGKGYEAIILTLYGSLIAVPIIIIFIPIFLFALPKIYSITAPLIPFILIFASLYLIFREEEFLISLTVFTLAGFLGFLTLNLPVKEPLLPLLTGLFGSSAIIISLKNKNKIPKQSLQKLSSIKIPKKELVKTSFAASLTAPLSSFLPGMGSGHSAVLASELTETNPRSFLFLVGIINTVVMALSFITIFSINKTRTGSAVAVKEILKKLSTSHLIIIILTIIISSILAFILGIYISKLSIKYINKISYFLVSIITLIILILLNLIITNYLGIIVLITATSLGIFCILSNSRRINLMGALIVPTIIFYLF